jgi:hypothetical protein
MAEPSAVQSWRRGLSHLKPGVHASDTTHPTYEPKPQRDTSRETQVSTSEHRVAAARQVQNSAAIPCARWFGLDVQSNAIMAANMHQPNPVLSACASQAPSHAQAWRARSTASSRERAQTEAGLAASGEQPA